MEENDKLWLLGMFMNISGSIMVNFGTNLMKSAHNLALENDDEDDDIEDDDKTIESENHVVGKESNGVSPPKYFSSSSIWKIGMSIFVIGSLVNFASFAFAAQSLLAALGTVQFISNVFFAKFILKEKLTTRIIVSTAVIIVGLTMAIIFSNHSTQLYTTHDLLNMYTPGYLLFMTFVIILLLFVHATYMIYTVNEDIGTPLPGNHLVRPVAYAMVSATVGTQSVLQSKCLAELIKATYEGVNQFDKPFVYIIVAIFALGLSFWLYRMNAALKKFDGLLIIPLLQVFWTTSAIVQGGVYFQEFIKFTPIQTVGFLTGVIIVFIGVYFLTPQPKSTPDEELLPTDSTHSQSDVFSTSTNSDSSQPGFYQRKRKHGGVGVGAERGRGGGGGEGDGDFIDSSTRSMVGLTYMPVIIESLPPRHHSHKSKGSSRHGMNTSSSRSLMKVNDIELQSTTNQLHAPNPQSLPQVTENFPTPSSRFPLPTVPYPSAQPPALPPSE